VKHVAVVGAGTMGNGIAQVYATNGSSVVMVDVSATALGKGLDAIRGSLARMVKKGTITQNAVDAALARIATATELSALGDPDLVVEAATEQPALKFSIFERLDAATPPATILATNTSSISITEIAARTSRPDRVIGMHFMNPVPLMTLVEMIRGQSTSADSMRIASGLCTTLGKTPIEAADYPGFIANRILMPMINEAIFAVMEGVGTPDAIDAVMKLGLNHPMGPLTLADFIGLDVCLAILTVLHDGIGDPKYRPCPLLRRMVAAGHLGRKSGQGFYPY